MRLSRANHNLMSQVSLFRHAVFTRYWVGDIASVLANQMLLLALGWQIYDLTSSAMSLGLVGLAHFGAQCVFTLPAGHIADRHDRRRVALRDRAVAPRAARASRWGRPVAHRRVVA